MAADDMAAALAYMVEEPPAPAISQGGRTPRPPGLPPSGGRAAGTARVVSASLILWPYRTLGKESSIDEKATPAPLPDPP